MSETYRCDDKELLVAYLYGDVDEAGRARFEDHLRACTACAREVRSLQGIRDELSAWLPPEPDLGFTIVQKAQPPDPPQVLRPPRWAWASGMPVWAQVAAATLVLATGAAIANVQVRYGRDGVVVTTGWMSPANADAAAGARAASPAEAGSGPGLAQVNAPAGDDWRPALAALERQVQQQLGELRAGPGGRQASTVTSEEGAALRRVNALIEESERRQRQELALRLTQLGRDLEVQRRADLVRIEQGLGQLDARTGAEVARQRQLLNYVMRASTQPVP